MARPENLDQFVFDKVSSNVAETPAADHIAQGSPTSPVPPGLNIAPPTTGVVDHFTGISFPELPDAADHGHQPGWLLGPI
jgi:hypothetical protein